MGSQHVFRDLQKFGEKIVKFKQTPIISAALVGEMIEKKFTGSVANGACAALSVAWLAETLGAASAIAGIGFQRHKGVSPAKNISNQKIVGAVAADFNHYVTMKKDYDGADFHWLSEKYGLKVDWERSLYGPVPLSLKTYSDDLKEGEGIILNYVCTVHPLPPPKVECHTIAFCKVKGGYLFFDPNFGGYKIKKDKVVDFANLYKTLIDTKVSDWMVHDGMCYVVSPQ